MAVPNGLNPSFEFIRLGGSHVIMAGALSGSATILAATGVVANGSLYLSSYTTSGEVYAMQNSKWVKIKVDGSQA